MNAGRVREGGLTAPATAAGVRMVMKTLKARQTTIILPDQVRLIRTYWLTCHRDIRPMRRERALISFLIDSISARSRHLTGPGGEGRA